MTGKELIKQLKAEPFEPFEIVTSAGQRCAVLHPEFAVPTRTGAVYIFQPTNAEDALGESPDIVSMLHITALEPLSKESNRSQ